MLPCVVPAAAAESRCETDGCSSSCGTSVARHRPENSETLRSGGLSARERSTSNTTSENLLEKY